MAIPLLGALGVVRNVAVGALLALNLYNELNEALDDDDNGAALVVPPPFFGGQCDGGYYIEVVAIYPSGNTVYGYFNGQTFFNRLSEAGQRQTNIFTQKLETVEVFSQSNGDGLKINGITIVLFGLENFTQRATSIKLGRLLPVSRPEDNCGNIGTPSIGNPNNGLYGFNFDGSDFSSISSGIAAAAALAAAAAATAAAKASTAAALGAATAAKAAIGAAAAAAASATTIGGLAAAIGSIVNLITDLLDLFRVLEEEKEKEKEKEKQEEELKKKIPRLEVSNFGTRQRDGFLSLYPQGREDIKAIQLNTILRFVPTAFGRFFGQLSPNRFIYQKLGYISFVASNLGVIETVDIEFPRHAITIPDNAIGFFFHFGLVGNVRIELEGLYEVYD